MTWHTQLGERTLKGAEAALIFRTIGHVADMVEQEIAGDSDPWEFGIPVFDEMQPTAKLALLADVGWALLRPTETCPKLTSINEAVVAALFSNIEQCLHMEIDWSKEEDDDELLAWRKLVLAVFHEDGDTMDLPEPDCDDVVEWELLAETLSQRILWDDDFNEAEQFLDASPDEATRLRSIFGIDNDYYAAVPPDPRDSDLPGIRAMLGELYRR